MIAISGRSIQYRLWMFQKTLRGTFITSGPVCLDSSALLISLPIVLFALPSCCQATIRVWSWASTPENFTVTWPADGYHGNADKLV